MGNTCKQKAIGREQTWQLDAHAPAIVQQPSFPCASHGYAARPSADLDQVASMLAGSPALKNPAQPQPRAFPAVAPAQRVHLEVDDRVDLAAVHAKAVPGDEVDGETRGGQDDAEDDG